MAEYVGVVNSALVEWDADLDFTIQMTLADAKREAREKRWPVSARVQKIVSSDGRKRQTLHRWLIGADGQVREIGRLGRSVRRG